MHIPPTPKIINNKKMILHINWMRSEFFLSIFFCFYEAVLVLFCWQSLLRANLLHCRELCNLCRSISVAIFTCSKFINVCVFMYRMSWFSEICISNLIQYIYLHSADMYIRNNIPRELRILYYLLMEIFSYSVNIWITKLIKRIYFWYFFCSINDANNSTINSLFVLLWFRCDIVNNNNNKMNYFFFHSLELLHILFIINFDHRFHHQFHE